MENLEFIYKPLSKRNSKKLKSLVDGSKKSSSNENSNETEEERKKRKNKEQLEQLKNEYLKNPHWSRAFRKEMAKKVGLKQSQIYKWKWD